MIQPRLRLGALAFAAAAALATAAAHGAGGDAAQLVGRDELRAGGYRFAASMGQPVTEIGPALTPLLIRNFPFASLSGISFPKMHFSVWRAKKKIADYYWGCALYPPWAFRSGFLDASREIRTDDEIRLSFVGTLKREEFAADLMRRIQESKNWQIGNNTCSLPYPGTPEPEIARIFRYS